MTVIGLTGGIASGKSTVARIASEYGATVIDADTLGHDVYCLGSPGYDAVVSEFGPQVLSEDGAIDRKKLGSLVFEDPDAFQRLTVIAWPEIRAKAEALIEAARAADCRSIIVLEAAVLIEAGWNDLADEVWVVTAENQTRIVRAMIRDSCSREKIERRLRAQMSDVDRKSFADVEIRNEGDEEELRAQVAGELLRVRQSQDPAS